MPPDPPHEFDVDLTPKDVQSLSSADGVTAFFSRLGYDTNRRLEQTPDNLGITAETTRRPIRRIERIAAQEGLLQVYLFELASVTVATTRALTRAFRNLSGNFLFLLTTGDFERLDFVLMERHVPSGAGRAGIGTRQAGVRPRVLTVERRNASRIQLRVLRRLTWTEPDPIAQFDKILSAYAIADWSEEHFNNRALFSDYFLLERLREFPEWAEDPKPAYRVLRDLYRSAASRFAGQTEGTIREQLLEPVLGLLGFRPAAGKDAGSDESRPDYRLLDPASPGSPVAFCLAYPWERFLDGKDYTRDAQSPEENPGALVVSLLERGEAAWGIVTNGRLWRLYSKKTHAKAANYYEIDLEEVLAQTGPHAPDPALAFRYFWLFFRLNAFVESAELAEGLEVSSSFLDRLLEGSEEYARELGDRLKDRVFLEVFPHLAAGFISDIRTSDAGIEEFTRSEWESVFQGTLTLLYRLLFILYAEARDLLPVKEVRGYYEASLKKIKTEIADAAGEIQDEAEARLSKAYRKDAFGLFERFQRLSAIVDRGEASLNVPFYNGGLFISEANPGDDDPESLAALFLARYRVPDRQLAVAIDLLSRDIDRRRESLVFIDYKSLGVRQLGSIYEGLLEFKLRIADRKLGVVREKGKEVYKPFRELTDRQKLRAEREKKIVRKGQAYLENDKRERKASGSYYTPDHIVKLIVEEAVAPVLSEKLDALRPKFREAQKWHLSRIRQAEAKGESPEKYRYGKAVISRWATEVIDRVFDIKVLDPATGSGHFLVEAVDLITDRVIDFLTAFPWNPVLAHLEQTRETILAEMDRQEVSVDPTRLTDVNLLRRHVLKRCVYGVDLNPMAVELAKVSLWLHCFTLGAPLSFLDHHLRCGNSLLGTTVAEVNEILQERGQLTLSATSAWEGLRQAVLGMITVGGLPDVTVEQVSGSRAAYRDAIVGLVPFKKMLDVHLARWFVEDTGRRRSGAEGSPFSEIVRNPELLAWASGREAPTLDAGGSEQLLHEVAEAAREKKFFHWELEFPEVYFGDSDVVADEGSSALAFDVVLGNPPYDVLAEKELGYDISSELKFFTDTRSYEPAIRGKKNLYKLFICRGLELAGGVGSLSFIVPMALLGDDQAAGVRKALLKEGCLRRIEVFPQKDDPNRRVFREAKLATIVFVGSKLDGDVPFVVRTHGAGAIEAEAPTLELRPSELESFSPEYLVIPSCTQRDWELAVRVLRNSSMMRLGDLAESFQGEVNETVERRRGALSDSRTDPLVLRGANICMYTLREASQGEEIHLSRERFVEGRSETSKAFSFRQRRVGFQRSSPQNNFRRLIAAPITRDSFCFDTVSFVTEESSSLDLDLFLALFNSEVLDWYFRLGSSNSKVNEYQFKALPAPSLEGYEGQVRSESETTEMEPEDALRVLETSTCEPGLVTSSVARALEALSRELQRIEAARTLQSREERSRLAADSRELQEAIDKALYKVYGFDRDEAAYIASRRRQML